MTSLDEMRRELKAKFERLKKREQARRETMLRYYEPLPSQPPLVPRREELLPPRKREKKCPECGETLVLMQDYDPITKRYLPSYRYTHLIGLAGLTEDRICTYVEHVKGGGYDRKRGSSNPDLGRYLIENIEDYAEQLVEMPEVKRKLEREIALMERLLKKAFSGTEKGNPCSGELTPEEIEVCTDILKKLRETEQIYIVDLDYPVSITKTLFRLLDGMRRIRAEKIGIPEEQFDIESYFAFILGLPAGLKRYKLKP